jgi:DNA-binding transcriptional ArsR family regulator
MFKYQKKDYLSMSFVDLSVQERVEALTSGVNSTGLKAATLWSMEMGRYYTTNELATNVWRFLGTKAASFSIPIQYCKASLEPIGMVVKHTFTGDMALAFGKTEDGLVYGHPSIARFLYVAGELDISLNSLNGDAKSPRELRHGFVVASVLELLRDGKERSVVDIARATGISIKTVSHYLNSVVKQGLVDYERIALDSFGNSETGYSVASLVNGQKLEYYIQNPLALRADTLTVVPYYAHWGYLERTLELRAGTLEPQSLAQRLDIHKKGAASVITLFGRLGIYKHERFKGKEVQSLARVNFLGEFVFDNVYRHILAIAREPESGETMRRFSEIMQELDVHGLFRQEIERYMREKPGGPGSTTTNNEVLSAAIAISERTDRPFRTRHVVEELDARGNPVKNATIRHSLGRLVRDGHLEVVEGMRPTHYRVRH